MAEKVRHQIIYLCIYLTIWLHLSNANYVLLQSGTCESNGASTIRSPSTCGSAAIALGLPYTSPYTYFASYTAYHLPPGCYIDGMFFLTIRLSSIVKSK